MDESDNIENSIMGTQKKGIDAFLDSLKTTGFQVLYVLRKDEEQEEGMLVYFIQNSLDYFQMHQFPFYVTINYIWKQNSFMEYVITMQNLFQISNYFPGLTFDQLLTTVYICLFLIILILADIIYVSYSFSQNRFKYMWPLYILRSITSLVVTVLFLPITETLTSIIQCYTDPETGQYVIYGYNNIYQQCWVGWFTFHALVDLICMVVFCFICGIVAYAFFEPGMTSKDKTARQNSFGEVAFITNKIACQLMYSLLRPDQPGQDWVLVLTTFVLAIWLAKVYNFDDPYYDFDVGLFYSIASCYYLWAVFWQIFSLTAYGTSFNGSLEAWMIGLPFIVSVMLLTKKSKIETLIRSQTKFRSGEQIWGHIRYVLQLIQNREVDKNSYMLLVGYIEKHKETCDNSDCPLKANRKKNIKYVTQTQEMDENCRGLIQELDKMFSQGLKKFPNSTVLRIFYALFLMERRNNKHKALEQFELALQTKPAFYQEFIIFRYKRDIKKGSGSTTGENQDDIVNIIAFRNHITVCEEMMKYSAKFHNDFWTELKEDQPDLGKLMYLGAKISFATTEAKDNYFRMQKINPNVPQTIRVFATFMINVLNDNKKGSELLLEAKQKRDQFKQIAQKDKDYINYENQPIPYLNVSAKKLELGQIVGLNALFSTFFGYQKEEILGKKINELMPQVYASAHDRFMIAFFENIILNLRMDVETISDYLDNDQSRLFKHKNGYLFSLTYRVMLNLDKLQYFVLFKGEATVRSQVLFIIDKQTKICDMSTGAITFFDLELKQLSGPKPILLNDYIPDVLKKNAKDVESKLENKDVRYYFKCFVEEIKLPRINREDSIEEEQKKEEFTGFYIVRLEKIERNEANLKYLAKKNFNSGSVSQATSNSDQIKQQQSQQRLQIANTSNESNDQKLLYEPEIDKNFVQYMQDLFEQPQYEDVKIYFKSEDEEQQLPSIDFADGYITKRLINGQILMINEEYDELNLQILEEIEEESSLFRNNNNQFEDEDDFRLFTYSNSSSLIKKVLNAHHSNKSITTFKLYSSSWICFIILVTSLQFYFVENYFQSYQTDIKVIEIIQESLIYMNQLTSRVLDILIQDNNLYQFNSTELETDINIISNNLISFNSYLNSLQYNYFSSSYDDQVKFRFYNSDYSYYVQQISLESSIMLLCSLALNTSVTDVKVTFANNYVQGVLDNTFNILYQQYLQKSSEIFENILDIMNNPQVELLILLGVSIFVSIIAMFKFIILMFEIKTQRENVLFLFLDIPVQHVDLLQKKCEKFTKNYIPIQELQDKNEQEGYESSEDEFEQVEEVAKTKMTPEDEDNLLKQSQNRKKIVKKYRQNRIKGNKEIIAQFMIIALTTLIFTVYNILSSNAQQNQINFLLPQYRQSLLGINDYGYYINLQKVMMINYSFSVQNDTIINAALNNLDVFLGNQLEMNQVNNLFIIFKFTNSLIASYPTLTTKYINTYYGDLCQYVKAEQLTDCQRILKGNLQLGIYNYESFALQYFRQNLDQFYSQQNYFSSLLSQDELYEIDRSLYNYAHQAVLSVTQYEQAMMIDDMSSTQQIQLILLIIFIVLLTAIFIFVWIPYLDRLNTQVLELILQKINQTIEMLNMIPMNVIKENKSIRRFVKNLIKNQNIY